jgi:hypothetical protein
MAVLHETRAEPPLTPLENARLSIALEEEARRLARAPAEASRRLWKQMMLSPSAEVFDALVEGQPVPLSSLDTSRHKRRS